MARPLRVEYAGAVYHVAVRGHARQGDTGITSSLFITGVDGRGGGGRGGVRPPRDALGPRKEEEAVQGGISMRLSIPCPEA
jgi:hypothetical protein